MNFLRFIGSLWPMLLLCALAGNIGFVVAAKALGLRLKEIVLCFGRPVWSVETRLAKLSLGYLPAGGFVSFQDEDQENMSLGTHFLLALSGSFCVMAISVGCLGWAQALQAFASGFGQLVFFLRSSFHSVGPGVALLRSFEAQEKVSWLHAFGILAAKMTALSWLPTVGGHTGALLARLSKRVQHGRYNRLVEAACAALYVLVGGFWFVSLIVFAFQ